MRGLGLLLLLLLQLAAAVASAQDAPSEVAPSEDAPSEDAPSEDAPSEDAPSEPGAAQPPESAPAEVVAAEVVPSPELAAARAVLEQAAGALAREDYETALRLTSEAYDIVQRDQLQYNMGLCLRALGRHRAAFLAFERAAGSTDLTEEAQLAARALADEMRAELGEVLIDGSPIGARVEVDGELRCSLPCITVEEAGARVVRAMAEGHFDASADLEVSAAGRAAVSLHLAPLPSPGWQPHPIAWAGLGIGLASAALAGGLLAGAVVTQGEYQAHPTRELLARGETLLTGSYVAWGVVAPGLALFVIGLALGEASEPADVTAERARGVVRF